LARPRRRGNNRATVRYGCAPATIGRLYVGEDHEFQHAWVLNLSRNGVGFILQRPVPAGIVVKIHMRGAEKGTPYQLSAQVVHCGLQMPGEWFVGCEFDRPLPPEVLDDLL
jgi:hypothetical protein